MRYVIEIPDDITAALEHRALTTGSEVVDVIENAVISYLRNGATAVSIGRLPDPPAEPLESAPPCDLPRNGPREISVRQTSRRLPDPIVDAT